MTKPMHVLGIHDGHNCGATLVTDGIVIASINEERLTRHKNDVGFPERSIKEVLRIAKVDASALAAVVYASNFMHRRDYLTDLAPWYKVGMAEQKKAESELKEYQKIIFAQRRQERIDDVVRLLRMRGPKSALSSTISRIWLALNYTAPNRVAGRPVLGLTCDGAGDGLCATVSVCRDNELVRIAATGRDASIGKIYSRSTFLMGMTPWKHRYKLIGACALCRSRACAAGG